jgi:Zn-dependent alcohol dehydrogenase
MEGAKHAGASRIIGVDMNPAKYEQGKTDAVTFNSSKLCKMTVWYMIDSCIILPA